MTRAEKTEMIGHLKEKLGNSPFFYIADSSTLTVEEVNGLRGLCFEKGVEMKVVKNTLVKKAMDQHEDKGYSALYETLAGPTTLFFSETANLPARIIKEFRKTSERPILKAAYIDSDVYLGDDQVETLASLKSKEELVGDIILLLQSPAKNVVSALQSAGSTLSGILKTLEERGS